MKNLQENWPKREQQLSKKKDLTAIRRLLWTTCSARIAQGEMKEFADYC